MNKTVTIILIVLLSIIAVVASFFLGFMIKGGYNLGSFSFNYKNNYSENLIDKQEFLSAEEINIETDLADIFVEESTDDKITIELYSENADTHYIKEENNIIEAKLFDVKKGLSFLRKQSRIIIKLPSSYDKKLNIVADTSDINIPSYEKLILNIDNKTGDLNANDLYSLGIKVTTGDIKVNNLKTMNATVSTGDVEVGIVDNLTIKTTTGDIRINEVKNKIASEQTTGDIRISTITVNEDSSIKTTTGDVKIDSLTNAYIESNTKTGSIKVNNNDRKLDNTITITTTTGDIRVNQ